MSKTITIVSGFGRCGTSLVMQMLEAGGMPMTGIWPAFEAEESAGILDGGSIDRAWLESVPGHAVKVLDPHRGSIPAGPDYRVIWCHRDHQEQAKSQTKFLAVMVGIPYSRDTVRTFARSYNKDLPAAMRVLRACNPKGVLELNFENILAYPAATAIDIANFCGGMNAEAMAKAVRPRTPQCATGMAMELSLLQEREAECDA